MTLWWDWDRSHLWITEAALRLMEEKRSGMPRPWGAKPLLATGSGGSAVAVGRGGVLHAP